MEYTELSAYPLPDGTLTTWAPVCEKASWHDDERGISYDHEAHLRDAVPGAWIGSVMRIPLRYDAGAVRRALRAWIARHEALRTTVRSTGGENPGWQRRSVAATEVDVRAEERGNVTTNTAHDVLTEYFAAVSPSSWPHCLFATVTEPGGAAFTVAFGADHSVMDAYSQLLWFQEFHSLYSRALSGEHDTALAAAEVGSHVDHSAAARSLAAVIDEQDPAVRRWHEFLAGPEDYRFPGYPAAAGSAGDPGMPQHSLSRWAIGPEDAERLERLCRGLGTGTQSGALAALALAARSLTGDTRLPFVMPMHTRHEREHADAVGWYVGLCPVAIELGAAPDFAGAVAQARAAVSGARGCAKTSFSRTADILGIEDTPRFVVSYVDVRGVPGATRWPEWNARALRSPEPSRDEVYLWLVHSAHGISVSARCARSDHALAAVEELIDGFATQVREAVAVEVELEVGA
ncbi:Aureobasidin A1 biosynthesis complex [Amycolatopsis acidicola]|uniref:Aureobasidin A1 biosynthesis complex n=1 Tax=Amycolatopsis acidicola TaxID=2596893 RepID=A0A5N0V9T2_9PSEU|nr:condensation domain-containing protein [Amycolatopsis acidicola]KAA9162023.1 Aureobasidin A1 biosynthesis complex [Amycolatopsis acidicola]